MGCPRRASLIALSVVVRLVVVMIDTRLLSSRAGGISTSRFGIEARLRREQDDFFFITVMRFLRRSVRGVAIRGRGGVCVLLASRKGALDS